MTIELIQLLKLEWHPTKNGAIEFDDVSIGSNKKFWWLCQNGHSWETTMWTRTTRNTTCVYCSNKKILEGYNDLKTRCPKVADEWHPTKNEKLTPLTVGDGSGKKVWWLCEKGHEWEQTIYSRTHPYTLCPVCDGRKILSGYNDLVTLYPNIAKEWHPSKNSPLAPDYISGGSHKKVWWLCEKGHEWQNTVSHRVHRLQNCPICLNQTTVEGINDLATLYPDVAKDWHPTKNLPLQPELISGGSNKKVWWLCEKGHESQASIAKRTKLKRKCAVCSNQQIMQGVNDISTTHKILLAKWHPTKNFPFLPTQFSGGSHKKVWWLCEKGHEWETTIADGKRFNCPKCNNPVSKSEKEIQDYIVTLGFNIDPSNRTILKSRNELDIYIPEKKIAIEFNGLYWHTEQWGKDSTYHHSKWLQCKEQGIQLVQVWEDEWNANPEQIKRMLAHKLGASQETKVFARKTEIIIVSKLEAEKFLKANHIQGFSTGSHYVGLAEKGTNNLVAVLVLKKEAGTEGKTLNIIRYATSANVIGGFTKLVTYAEQTYKPEKFITFSDNCVSDGGLYANNGFVADKELAPDYTYLANGRRQHKFGYRLKRFRNDPTLLYIEGYTERQLAELNGLERIWDAGKTRWIKEIKHSNLS